MAKNELTAEQKLFAEGFEDSSLTLFDNGKTLLIYQKQGACLTFRREKTGAMCKTNQPFNLKLAKIIVQQLEELEEEK